MTELQALMKAGAFLGHRTYRWNPRMAKYIYARRNGIHILDLVQTVQCLDQARSFIKTVAKKGGTVLFLGTSRHAAGPIMAAAARSNSFYVNQRWLGGMFTNWSTMRLCVHRLTYLDQCAENGTFATLPKREEAALRRQHARLKKYLGGLCGMEQLPNAMIVTGQASDSHALAECRRSNVTTIGILDSDGDPTSVDYVIPANDDSAASLDYILTELTYCLATKAR